MAFNVLVGVAAPLLWTAQNTYVGRSAVSVAKLLQEPTEKWTTSLLDQGVSWASVLLSFAGLQGPRRASSFASLLLNIFAPLRGWVRPHREK